MPGNIEREGSGEITYISNLSVASYNFSVSDENGCSSELSGNAEILSPPDNPDPPVLESISPPTCTRSTGIISLGGLPSGSWTLTRVQGGVTRTGTGSTLSIENVVSGSYNYRVRNEEGCSSEMSESMVVPPQPEIPSAPLVDQITQPTCEEPLGRVLLSGLPTEGAWTLVRFPGSISITGSGEEMEITGLLPGIYNYLVSSEAGCTSSASENIRINVSPDVPETPAVGQVIQPGCTNPVGSITLTGLPTGNWTLTRYPDEITTTGAGTITTISDLEPGNYSFRVSNSSGCTSQESQTISIISNPDAPELIITDPQPVCEPETVDLRDSLITAGSTAGLSFTYYQDEELSMEVERPDSATDGIYYIRAQSREGCIAIGQVEVSVVSPPIAEAGPDQVLEYEFETYLQANLFSLNDTGTWSAASGTAYFDDVNDPETRVYDLQLGSTLLEWTVRNGICEPVSDSVMIEVQDLVVPTLVTPNMDGKNDYLIFEGLDNLGRTELTIFDRYGAVVFESDNYQNDWNGVNQDGNPLPDDTYFYVFTSENGRAKSSFVVIRR
jgi:gliding motility-associated-like protein